MFIDSFMHLPKSLDTLVTNLHAKPEGFDDKFGIMIQHFSKERAVKLSRKGVYPYSYFSSWDKFKETKFPDISEFYNTLTCEGISQEDYDFGKSVFETECTDLGSYHDIYLTTDVLLLACVFESYRDMAISNFKLDPCHYFSLPGFSWDAALLSTKVKLELVTDQDMYNTIESGIRGGVSMISHRYSEAYNKYMEDYEEGVKEDSFLLYIDKNNLYGEALQEPLPVSDFQWESQEFIDNLSIDDILAWGDEDEIGRILVVNLEYPCELHLLSEHNEYSLAPEKITISMNQLSQHQRELLTSYNIKYSEKQKKLVPHLGSRKMYPVHYRNLKYYLEKGMVLTKIHKIIKFVQRPWLKDFVNLCCDLRRKATNKSEQDFFKLIVNAIFGRSMMHVRNQQNVYIVNSIETAKYYSRLSNFRKCEILSPNLVLVFMSKPSIVLDKPIYTAFSVLDLSKLFIMTRSKNGMELKPGSFLQIRTA
ncbi:uncharacterized protein LOC110858869 [Folsomia candida]|uniref:uncharacterized protein LOC110858869 n=1 Tax=Folsomia candida TaxID=158441 RepID=UPI0016050264|nr:uncharacterized protein LOC110858869 [Folsomia candida]XP_035715000.1 uncharacterized protein LOC110858869 [Folsomia candida]XP_035715001.1 uncharacterized protein LOC110858869 [Folsomia candida]XP_035715002.1 uncharacterized protein LOC110858869 [Folsomia candida]XP_035715003.1 uncharacterized protein LOC110858869 [Folsomia candida]XP_035715004.1 uncharacterized protein LOC110858869 [Folsomia candida]XP_035715005.1 uncharacterized protein LOC110858869 [Folsomia candida]XP_035715006.1 unc